MKDQQANTISNIFLKKGIAKNKKERKLLLCVIDSVTLPILTYMYIYFMDL